MNIPDDLKELYEEFGSPYYEMQAIYLAELPRKQLLALIERIAKAERALADKYRLGFEDCRARAMHVVDEHDGYLERIGNLEPTLTNPAFKLESE
jgi:hypothetical protein